MISDVGAESVRNFLREKIKPKSALVTDRFASYTGLECARVFSCGDPDARRPGDGPPLLPVGSYHAIELEAVSPGNAP